MTDREALIEQLIDHGAMLPGREDARAILNDVLDDAILDLAIFAWFPPLDSIRQRAIIDLRFHCGHEGFRMHRDLIAAMARKDYPRASREVQRAFRLHPARATRVGSMLETGEDLT